MNVVTNSVLQEVRKTHDGKVEGRFAPHTGNETSLVNESADEILLAIGREPLTTQLNLEVLDGIQVTEEGHIKVDEMQNTHVDSVYALGDVCGNWELTPVAIAAGAGLRIGYLADEQHAKCTH